MGQYIFTPPAKSYDLPFTFAGLFEYIQKGRAFSSRKLGTTLTFDLRNAWTLNPYITVTLYETQIAVLFPDGSLHISAEIDNHGSHATTYWIQKILNDNNYPGFVAREGFKYPQAGQTYYPATHYAQEAK